MAVMAPSLAGLGKTLNLASKFVSLFVLVLYIVICRR
jgi:hypothetical protein